MRRKQHDFTDEKTDAPCAGFSEKGGFKNAAELRCGAYRKGNRFKRYLDGIAKHIHESTASGSIDYRIAAEKS